MEIILKVEGMHCGMCEAHVNDAVRKAVPEVKSVKSSHEKGETVIVCGSDCSEAARAAVEAEGYHVLGVETKEAEKKGFFAKLFKK